MARDGIRQTGSGFSLKSGGKLSLMGNGRGGSTGSVSVLVVNDQMIDIASQCDRYGQVDTAVSICTPSLCGGSDRGSCVAARTLQGYYCYCSADGLPALRCNGMYSGQGQV